MTCVQDKLKESQHSRTALVHGTVSSSDLVTFGREAGKHEQVKHPNTAICIALVMGGSNGEKVALCGMCQLSRLHQ